MKRIALALTAALMVFSLAAVAFAEGDSTAAAGAPAKTMTTKKHSKKKSKKHHKMSKSSMAPADTTAAK